MDDLGTSRLCVHHETKSDGMCFGEVRAFDENAIGIDEIFKIRRGTAATE